MSAGMDELGGEHEMFEEISVFEEEVGYQRIVYHDVRMTGDDVMQVSYQGEICLFSQIAQAILIHNFVVAEGIGGIFFFAGGHLGEVIMKCLLVGSHQQIVLVDAEPEFLPRMLR